jgi:hypothetical protein
MEPFGMAACCAEQARDGVFGHADQASGGPHAAPFAQMIDNGRRPFFCDLGIEQRGATSLGELLAACPAA